MHSLPEVINEIDRINQEDPRKILYEGKNVPQEYLYSLRMTEMLKNYDPEAGELLQIAARGQHIRRWEISRAEFRMDRKGYLQWRTKLKVMHGDLLAEIMNRYGYSEEDIAKIRVLVTKQHLKTDEDSQKLEDVVCIVFLKYYFEDFAKEQPEAKLVDILKKTWNKMTQKGQKMAMDLDLPEETKKMVRLALVNSQQSAKGSRQNG